jgi:hypothetical protein
VEVTEDGYLDGHVQGAQREHLKGYVKTRHKEHMRGYVQVQMRNITVEALSDIQGAS